MAVASRSLFKQTLWVACLVLAWSGHPAQAQSEASQAVSALPVASLVGVAGSAAAGSAVAVAVPVALTVSGATLVVKAVEASARGTVWVLERASDGARVSVEWTGRAAHAASIAVGTAVTVSVIAAGAVLSAAGEVLCFIPNGLGQGLLHHKRVTN